MISANAAPGLAMGALGLTAGFAGFLADEPVYGLAAGALAVAAGLHTLSVTKELQNQEQRQDLVKQELNAVQQQASEAEDALRDLESQGTPESSAELLIDAETGLFSENFFGVALESRIASARRHLRPISVIVLDVAGDTTGELHLQVARAVKATIRDADTACRFKSGKFALVLEDTPETGAVWTVERVRRALAEQQVGLTVWAGVACYPAHAFTRDEIIEAAEQALKSAQDWQQDRIEVAAAVD